MSSAFGFTTFPQKPSPDPRAVGQALAQARMRPQPAMPTSQPSAGMVSPTDLDPREKLRQLFRALTTQAGRERGGPGQTGTGSAPAGQPNYPGTEGAHSAMHASIGDAAQRIANGVMAPPDMTATRSAARRGRLLDLGVTPFEASLLSRSGGI